MSDLVSLSTLRSKSRFRADLVNSNFVTDAELNGYIQDSYKELYDLLVEAVEDYGLTSSNVTISSGNTMPIPATLYKLRGVDDITDTGNPRTVRKFMFGERNDYLFSERMSLGAEFADVMYRMLGSVIEILPPDRAARPYTLWFVPTPTVPTADSDTIDVINGFDEYIVIDAAIKCKIKSEENHADLDKAKANMLDRVYRMRKNRDQNIPEKVTRIRNRRRTGFYSYIGDTSL